MSFSPEKLRSEIERIAQDIALVEAYEAEVGRLNALQAQLQERTAHSQDEHALAAYRELEAQVGALFNQVEASTLAHLSTRRLAVVQDAEPPADLPLPTSEAASDEPPLPAPSEASEAEPTEIPAEDQAFATADLDASHFRKIFVELEEDLEDLKHVGGALRPYHLKARIEELVGRAGLLQQEFAPVLHLRAWNPEDKSLAIFFGKLSTHARDELLGPYGLSADGLKRDVDWDFQAILESAEDTCQAEEAERAREHEHERLEAIRREEEEQRAELARQQQVELLPEIQALAASAETSSDEWIASFRSIIEKYLALGDEDEALLELLAPHESIFATGKAFRSLRKKLQRHSQSGRFAPVAEPEVVEEDEVEDAPETEHEHEHEAYRGHWRGQVGLIVGGDNREEHRAKLEKFFAFRKLIWQETRESSSTLRSPTKERIRKGKYDVVFYNVKFARHATSDLKGPCQEAGIPFVYLTHGYGIGAFVRAIQEQPTKAV